MKGLLRNNLYATLSNAKAFSVFMILFGLFAVAVISQSLQIGYVMTGIIGFSVNAIAVSKNEFASKWGKYKLTLPVKRKDIVKSLFFNQIIWLLAGTLFVGIEISLSWLFHGCPFDQSIDILTMFALGISILNDLLEPGTAAIVSGAVALTMRSLLAFALSYPLSVTIFRRREY